MRTIDDNAAGGGNLGTWPNNLCPPVRPQYLLQGEMKKGRPRRAALPLSSRDPAKLL